jgi:gamma-butyrobetaine dioxygenase
MIGVDVAGRIREVRYNSRSMEPMRPRAGNAPEKAALQMREFYRAYRALATILLAPDLTMRFSLEPGDCIVFDNTRILHSRTGFTATGRRHLQGCYADIDGAESTVAVLARRHAAAPDTAVPDIAAPDTAVPDVAAPDAAAPDAAAPDAVRPEAANIGG